MSPDAVVLWIITYIVFPALVGAGIGYIIGVVTYRD